MRISTLKTDHPKLRFECLANCALCCSYKVTLLEDDIDRLRRGGYEKERFWQREGTGQATLRRNSQSCIFLDADRRCRVYDLRPTYCRFYPLIREIYYRLETDVDYSCPGIGFGKRIAEKEFAEVVDSPNHEECLQRQRHAIDLIENLLKKRLIFSAERWMPLIAMALFKGREGNGFNIAYHPVVRVGNIITEGDSYRFLDQMSKRVRNKKTTEIFDRSVIEKQFGKRIINTRLQGKEVSRYTLSFIKDSFVIALEDGVEVKISFEDLTQLDWQEEALNSLKGYLEIWLERQLPIRLAHALALSSPLERNLIYFYLDFLGLIFQRLTILSSLIAFWRGEAEISRDILAEAIRGTDNVMRARCMNARIAL